MLLAEPVLQPNRLIIGKSEALDPFEVVFAFLPNVDKACMLFEGDIYISWTRSNLPCGLWSFLIINDILMNARERTFQDPFFHRINLCPVTFHAIGRITSYPILTRVLRRNHCL